jgi:hypothetical protein
MTDDRVAPHEGVLRPLMRKVAAPRGGPLVNVIVAGGVRAPGFLARGFVAPGFLARGFVAPGFVPPGFLAPGFLARGVLAAGIVVASLLAGCAKGPDAAAGSTLRVYAADLAGAAKVCDVPKVTPVAAAGAGAPMKMANDGGWCGISVHQDGPKPFEAGLLTERPKHGTVLIHEVGDDTRIDYTPDRGFAGSDAFVVKLIPGNATIQAAVTVTAPKS